MYIQLGRQGTLLVLMSLCVGLSRETVAQPLYVPRWGLLVWKAINDDGESTLQDISFEVNQC